MTTQSIGARIKRNEDPRLLTGRALFVDDLELAGMVHVAFLRSPYAHARILGIDASRARQREGVIAVYTAADLGSYWQHGPLLVPPPPVEGMVFNERTQVPLAKDKVRQLGEPIAVVVADLPLRRRGRAAGHRGRLRAAAGGGGSGEGAGARRSAGARGRGLEPRRLRAAEEGGLRGRQGAGRRGDPPPLPLRPRRRGGDREPRGRRAVGRARAEADDLGHHPGADPGAQRPGRHAGPLRAPGAAGDAVHRRRLRPQDHDVLSGRGADPLDRPAARAAGEMDRGPRGELRRHHPGARADPRRRDRPDARRPHPRRQGLLPARHRRLRSLRPHRAAQQPVHRGRPLPRARLRERVPGGVHQQDDRHPLPRRRPPARRVRDRAADGPRGPRAGDRRQRDPPPQLPEARRVPARPRDHLSGFRAALLRQRRLRAGARQDAADDRLRTLRRRGAAAAARRGAARRDRRRRLRRGHRHRAVRGGAGAGADERQGHRRHRHRHAGAGALHGARPDRRAAARRRGGGRRRGHRRQRSVPLGDRHLRQPRRGGGGQCHERSGEGRAREGGAAGRRAARRRRGADRARRAAARG